MPAHEADHAVADAMPLSRGREFRYRRADFQRVRRLLQESAGIALHDCKQELVYSRLARRLRALGLDRFDAYLDRVEADEAELARFVNALTTNLTAFFREPHHFEYLSRVLVPQWRRERREPMRIWSAGCSTGEEAYSIAMTLAEALADGRPGFRILATDLDTDVLAKAEAGIYARDRVEGLDRARLKRWFQRGRGRREGWMRVVPELREHIRFRPLNLFERWPMRHPLDVIFCRNVAIYFDKPTQRTLYRRFHQALAPGGHLFVGHAESLFRVCDDFERVGQSVYRKRG